MEPEFGEAEGTADAGDELDLSESDSLPWLEADEEDDEGGLDMAQIIGFGAVLIALLLGIVGAIYLISNSARDDAPIADGSTIEAPEGPIKERPDDPQGKEFAGTGNVAPAVGEGQTRESQIGSGNANAGGDSANGDAANGGAASSGSNAAAASSGDGAGSASGSSTSGVGVQLAAYSSRARAEQGWSQLVRQTDALSGVRYRVVEGVVDSGTVYRLQAVASDRAAADALCRAIKADGLDCAVKS
ncbi:SPOR domain-containing protein [Erythrobacter crassostreae]|uniref:SPOR domain-containing protein n=1 Tax=Erythrobacter crassostreae TaxID=2828328 RepID=A0A9X1JPB8_9SPHN|nr:SPOR domain-containing protein [Erythrobacter crassostrea]MBV7259267.1 SPOR domain-containing protein [Erythrobacter crassostrea]